MRPTLTNQSYWQMSVRELRAIVQSACEAAAMYRGTSAETRYLDQANDACTVIAYKLKERH